MKRLLSVVSVMVFLAGAAFAKPPAKVSAPNVQPFPGTLINARYVYVTGYDGNEFNSNILPEDRHAINTVQDAVQMVIAPFPVVARRPPDRRRARRLAAASRRRSGTRHLS